MGRLRPVLIGALIIADVLIFFGTPFRDSGGGLPRSLRETFGELGSDPAGTALPVVRLLLGLAVLAATIDLLLGYWRRPRPLREPADAGSEPVTAGSSVASGSAATPGAAAGVTGAAALTEADLSGHLESASLAVRDRWHDLPDWRWVLAEDQQVRDDDDHPAWSVELSELVPPVTPVPPVEPGAPVNAPEAAELPEGNDPAAETPAGGLTGDAELAPEPAASLESAPEPAPRPVETFDGLIDRFTVTIQSTIDVDEAVRRIEVHDALRDLAEDHDALDHRRAVVASVVSGHHWPFHGSSTLHLSSIRGRESEASFFDGLFVLRDRAVPPGELGEYGNDRYLVAAAPLVTAVLERDPDLVVAVVDHLGPVPSDDRDEGLPATRPPIPATGRSPAGAPPSPPQSQGAVFKLQVAEGERKSEANTSGDRHIVSVARIRRLHLSDQAPNALPDWSVLAAKPDDITGVEADSPASGSGARSETEGQA